MPKRPQTEDLTSIIEAVRQIPDGARRIYIAKVLGDVPQHTLQYRLKSLVDSGQLTQEGKGPAARYWIPNAKKKQQTAAEPQAGFAAEPSEDAQLTLSKDGAKIRDYVRQPHGSRKAVGYNRQFLDSYRPTRACAVWLPISHSSRPICFRSSFTDVPRSTYTNAILSVYELNKANLLKDVFI